MHNLSENPLQLGSLQLVQLLLRMIVGVCDRASSSCDRGVTGGDTDRRCPS
jgi:hypothetical protein